MFGILPPVFQEGGLLKLKFWVSEWVY
ncbi:hypothetical protein V3C99_017198 [Haemonchus contortus]